MKQARVLSALVLIPLVVGAIWCPIPIATFVLAEVAAVLATLEYVRLAGALGARVPRAIVVIGVMVSCWALAISAMPQDHVFAGAVPNVAVAAPVPGLLDVVLLSVMIVVCAGAVALQMPGPGVLRDVAVALMPVFYIGLPLGALAAVRVLFDGRRALLLLAAVIVLSDSAQYYVGRAAGKRPLAPAISPGKTREGAVAGLVVGTAAFLIGAHWIFPGAPAALLTMVGLTTVAAGMVGDLFESLLKRSAGVKDSSGLIPGHGGVLDRIDSWLFAAPIYYVFVRYLR
jgi:phosphatidate cytidylyltransferase